VGALRLGCDLGGLRFAATALRCSGFWPAVELASLTSFAALERRPRVS
jgi:hypothetical protein